MASNQQTGTDEEAVAERSMFRAMVRDSLIGAPIGALLFAGIGALALSGSGREIGWAVAGVAAVGVLAGVFFGLWAGITSRAALLDHLDEDVEAPEAR